MVPEAVKNSIAEKRLALWVDASRVLGNGVRLNGLSERELKEAVATKVLGDAVDVKALPAGALDGVFLTATTARANSTRALASLGSVLLPTEEERTNARDGAETPFERSQREAAEAFKNRARGAQKGA
jgi:hypothetical protein